jgi:hypothetical protein
VRDLRSEISDGNASRWSELNKVSVVGICTH